MDLRSMLQSVRNQSAEVMPLRIVKNPNSLAWVQPINRPEHHPAVTVLNEIEYFGSYGIRETDESGAAIQNAEKSSRVSRPGVEPQLAPIVRTLGPRCAVDRASRRITSQCLLSERPEGGVADACFPVLNVACNVILDATFCVYSDHEIIPTEQFTKRTAVRNGLTRFHRKIDLLATVHVENEDLRRFRRQIFNHEGYADILFVV